MSRPKLHISFDHCKDIASAYKTRQSFRKGHPTIYGYAYRNKFLNVICQHMTYSITFWTEELLLEDARKYNSKIEWLIKSKKAYNIAVLRGILHICTAHMKDSNIRWSNEAIVEDAKKYSTISEWRIKSNGAYCTAHSRGIFNECVMHMKKSHRQSRPELEILNIIRTRYPGAKNKRFSSKTLGDYPFRSLEIDIYIPELRKGIEFNGDYWHGKGFSRKWTSDPEEYHSTKKEFFKKLKIDYIEIDEFSWKNNKQECIKSINSFLEAYTNDVTIIK